MELCGGTHVRATGDIGPFLIAEETGVAAGVRRIEAVTGAGAVARAQEQRRALDGILGALGTTASAGVEAVQRLTSDTKRLAREVESLTVKLALSGGSGQTQAADDTVDVQGVTVLRRRADGLEKGARRALADSLRDRVKSGVVVIASAGGEKVTVVAAVTKDLTGRLQAGKIIRELAPIVGGGGGGRPDFAEAGGKDAAKIGDLLDAVPGVVQKLLA
jgi:alanyl-tRNA synthetase